MRRFTAVWAGLLLATVFMGCVGMGEGRGRAEAGGKKPVFVPPYRVNGPNVIWIAFDALRAQNLSCYGYDRKTTPSLDRLAENGVLFESHCAQGFHTLDSVPSYLTGRYFPVMCLGRLVWREAMRTPPPNEYIVSQIMRANGYQTMLVSAHAWMTEETRLWRSFDQRISVEPEKPEDGHGLFDDVVRAVLKSVEQRDRTEPFFMYVHAMDTHSPHFPLPEFDQWLPAGFDKPNTLSAEAKEQYVNGLYDGSLAHADAEVGKLLAELGERKILSNTVIVISADHGEVLTGDGAQFRHYFSPCMEMTRTPLIIAGPGVPKGGRVKQLSENVDIVPTLVDLLGLRTDADMDGKSLVPLAKDPAGPPVHEYALTVRRQVHSAQGVVLQTGEFIYDAEEKALYKQPCHAGRVQLLDGAQESLKNTLDGYIEKAVMPKMNAFLALKQSTPAAFYALIPVGADPPEAYVPFAYRRPDDNKWDLSLGLVRVWPEEKAPPITFHMEVPNGQYRVMMEMASGTSSNGGPQSAVVFRTEEESVWKAVCSPVLDPKPSSRFVDIGEYKVRDGSFDITLRQAYPGASPVSISQFRFEPMKLFLNTEEENGEKLSVETERLRALGYLE